jgi:uncharacterized protein YeaO (DUF488 family)
MTVFLERTPAGREAVWRDGTRPRLGAAIGIIDGQGRRVSRLPARAVAVPESILMPIRTVRLGSPRHPHEGVRLGTVRRLPRGVRKEEYASRDYFDVWVPELAPSAALLSWAQAVPWTAARWTQFVRRYRAELRAPPVRRLLEMLAALSRTASFSIGCYCADESRCHRAVLADILRAAGASVHPAARRPG